MQTKTLEELPPEQRRAIEILMRNWPTDEILHSREPLKLDNFKTNHIGFTLSRVTSDNLPVSHGCKWRQNRSRVRVEVDPETTVILQKLNPRETDDTPDRFEFRKVKLWNMRVKQPLREFTCIYIEKGFPQGEETDFLEDFLNNTTFDSLLGNNFPDSL